MEDLRQQLLAAQPRRSQVRAKSAPRLIRARASALANSALGPDALEFTLVRDAPTEALEALQELKDLLGGGDLDEPTAPASGDEAAQ